MQQVALRAQAPRASSDLASNHSIHARRAWVIILFLAREQGNN